ncbi:hypothetical protein [Bradyrhizobium sp. CSA112]|uniref:hypothetical protein n=1 Tax=Bradyrhizobium sp. CSA112 TaxID=2699170 RepID=UPI0023B00B97|nr:hypothetical protein [Bradyrhizobium sp. CSA112]
MVELLFIAQLARQPLQAVAWRWWCRSLYRASREQRRCRECTKSRAALFKPLLNS